jgi:hypothetical protein
MTRFRILFLLSFLQIMLHAYEDQDMDGVDDKDDKCLYTPFMELVDSDGCSTEVLLPPYKFSLIAGLNYSDTDYNTLSKTDTLTTSLEINYTYEDFIFSFSTSYYMNNSNIHRTSGMNDTYLGVDYLTMLDEFYVTVGSGLILPTYDSIYGTNKVDYTLNLNVGYALGNVNYFGVLGHTWIGDTDVVDYVEYKDTNYFSLGVGYLFSPKLYVSSSYNQSDSIYVGVGVISTASMYLFYEIDEELSVNLSYAYGLSDMASDNYLGLNLGYKF